MNLKDEPFDRLVRRHKQTEVALEELARDNADVSRDEYDRIAEKEESYRVERVRRAYNREGRDAEAETKRVGVVA